MNGRAMRRMIRTPGRDMGRFCRARTGVVRNTQRADFRGEGVPLRHRAGSGAPEALREGQTSGASRGTIQTQPTRPAMLTSAAVTKAAAK